MRGRWELSDAQWQLIEPIFATEATLRWSRSSPGKIHEQSSTVFCESWGRRTVVRTAKEVSAAPDLHRRFQQWVREGKLEHILRTLAEKLQARGKLQLEEAFIDACFVGGKKGGRAVGPSQRGKGTKIIALADDHSLALAVSIESASPHESHLVITFVGL